MKLGDYITDRIIVILINAAGIFFISLFLLLLQNQIMAVLLLVTAWVLVLLIYGGIDYYQRKRYFDKVEGILEQLEKPYLISEVAPVGSHIEDRIYHDILRRSNKSVIDAIHEKEHEQKDYKEFIESWVHEAKTPLTSAMLMCENPESSPQRMKLELQRIEQQIDMVLYYARMDHANRDYLIHPYDLRKMVSEAIQKNRVYLRQYQAQVEVDMEETIVSTDEKWLEFILTQFITNAIKYRSKRPLHLRFWRERRESQVVLFMEDQGIGIAKEELGKIFDKGYTGKNGRTTRQSTGMGLYLCKQLCDKLGIGIQCESVQGAYTRMILVFPDSEYMKVDM